MEVGIPHLTAYLCRLSALAVVAGAAAAQTVPPLPQKNVTLLEAVQSLLERHPLLQVQQQEVVSRRGALQSASAQFDPTFNTSVSHNRANAPMTRLQQEQAGVPFSNVATNLTSYAADLSRQLRNGITIGPSFTTGRTTDQLTNRLGLNTSKVSFQVNIPLLRNRGRETVTARERAAQIDVDASLLDLNQNVSELILNAANAYWNNVAARRLLEIAQGAEDRGRRFLADLRELVKADRAAPAELNQLLANESERRAKRIATEQAALDAGQALAVAMGVPLAEMGEIPVATETFPDPERQALPPASLAGIRGMIAQALERRADYLAIQKRQQSSKVLLAAAQDQLRPRLDLNFTTGYSGLHEGTRPDGLLVAPFQNVKGLDAVAGITYSLPIRNNAARGQIVQTEAGYRQAVLRANEIGRNIASEVVAATTGLASAVERLRVAREGVRSYAAALQAEREKFPLGLSSQTDILTVEDRLTAAEENVVAAQLAYALAVERLRFATGTFIQPDRAVNAVERAVLFSPPVEIPSKERNP